MYKREFCSYMLQHDETRCKIVKHHYNYNYVQGFFPFKSDDHWKLPLPIYVQMVLVLNKRVVNDRLYLLDEQNHPASLLSGVSSFSSSPSLLFSRYNHSKPHGRGQSFAMSESWKERL